MKSNRTEGNRQQLAENVKRRLGKLADEQVDLRSGERDRAKRALDTLARQQGIEPPSERATHFSLLHFTGDRP